MAKKTFHEKLRAAGDLPKIEDLSDRPEYAARVGGSKMYIAAPLQYHALMARVPEGQVVTTDALRRYLARAAGADVTCPLTAGIFINICAHASQERAEDKIPYWRTLKTGGVLNEKYPGGAEEQAFHLRAEGHEIEEQGKTRRVKGWASRQWDMS